MRANPGWIALTLVLTILPIAAAAAAGVLALKAYATAAERAREDVREEESSRGRVYST